MGGMRRQLLQIAWDIFVYPFVVLGTLEVSSNFLLVCAFSFLNASISSVFHFLVQLTPFGAQQVASSHLCNK